MRALALPLVALLAACENPAATPATRTQRQLRSDPTILVSPVDGATFVQNDPTIGCPAHPHRGYGFRTHFDWRDVEGASQYMVVFQHQGSTLPAVARRIAASELTETWCNAFVTDANREHWTWSVYALGPATGPFTGDSATMPRDTLLWSGSREYNFGPCRLDDGRACFAAPEDTTTP
ncbi:MAG TPA: hypothetical protein VHM30_11570 [Gemmatimonadaceae bacterium]|nr:hypothetical protein [Gemmatimonadaceae bacterium]